MFLNVQLDYTGSVYSKHDLSERPT